jgi:hypothetical protein
MNYFKYFPKINYKFEENGKFTKQIVDLTAVPKIVENLKDKDGIFVDYIVKDGERPEHIAKRVYGREDLHWIILLSNQIVNPYFDWPLSNFQLDRYIEDQYKGTAIFFPSTINNTRFKIKDTSSYLSSKDSYFEIDSEITQGSRTATVNSWDPTFRKLQVIDASDYNFNTYTILYGSNGTSDFEIYPVKVVLYNKEAVHHFVDDFGNILDPYGKINVNQYSDQKIYSTSSIFYNSSGYTNLDDSNNYALNRYLGESFESNTITNETYEYQVNDLKRNIKILKVEYIDSIVSDIENLFK